jgi:hypothetical protein
VSFCLLLHLISHIAISHRQLPLCPQSSAQRPCVPAAHVYDVERARRNVSTKMAELPARTAPRACTSAICPPNPWATEVTTYRRESQLDPVNHSPATGTSLRAPQASDMAHPCRPCPATSQAVAKSTCFHSSATQYFFLRCRFCHLGCAAANALSHCIPIAVLLSPAPIPRCVFEHLPASQLPASVGHTGHTRSLLFFWRSRSQAAPPFPYRPVDSHGALLHSHAALIPLIPSLHFGRRRRCRGCRCC